MNVRHRLAIAATAFALFSPLAASPLAAQDPVPDEDWAAHVDKAANHGRMRIRMAAARKVASGGEAALPALRAFVAANGRNALPMVLVLEVGKAEPAAATTAWLEELAGDATFYWRSHALDGLAARATPAMRPRFEAALADPSHLMRAAGARGLLALGDPAAMRALLEDEDPRNRVTAALELLEAGDESGLPTLVTALSWRELGFLDDGWGRREATRAARALRAIDEDAANTALNGDADVTATAIGTLWGAVTSRLDRPLALPAGPPTSIEYTGGVALRSCRHGDLFLRWNDVGELFVGLGEVRRRPLDLGTAWNELRPRLEGLPADESVVGDVICDFARLRGAAVHVKAAPGALPAPLTAWLTDLAAAIETAGDAELAAALRLRLAQFAAGG